MSNENNVVSFTEVKNSAVESAIIAGMQDRGGNSVSEPFLISLGSRAKGDITAIFEVINKMVTAGTLEKTFQAATDSKHRSYQLPLYRLVQQLY